MTIPKTATCDACLEVGDPRDLVEIAGDMVCDNCIDAVGDHFSMDDATAYGDTTYGDDSWVDYCDGEAELAHWDDDPNPYHGNYSEM